MSETPQNKTQFVHFDKDLFPKVDIDGEILVERLKILGSLGRDGEAKLSRLTGSDADKLGRDQVVAWFEQAGLVVEVDAIGNIFGILEPSSAADSADSDSGGGCVGSGSGTGGAGAAAPVMLGSHIDSVIDAGIYDGCFGVLAGLSALEAIKSSGVALSRPLVVAAFSNEEGVRYSPGLLGSLVYSGVYEPEKARRIVGIDSSVVGEELDRIGYSGTSELSFIQPYAYLEAHIEQGPVLESEAVDVAAVEDLNGITWLRIIINGRANHAGTTPKHLRSDAGLAFSKLNVFLAELVAGSKSVATVGRADFSPNAANVIPARVDFTIDLRGPDLAELEAHEVAIRAYLDELTSGTGAGADFAGGGGLEVEIEALERFEPVVFDAELVERIESCAHMRSLPVTRMTSGAGHDAQIMSQICPAAMIFVPSRGGVSHNPEEYTEPRALISGAQLLSDTALSLAKT